LSLVYNSGAADALLEKQAGIAGPGFELAGLSWIQLDCEVNKKWFGADELECYDYYLNFNGVSEKLIHDDENSEPGRPAFYTEHKTFRQIVRVFSGGGSHWIVTLPDGTQYRFGGSSNATSYYLSGEEGVEVYRYNLDQIQDVYSNTVLINYTQLSASMYGKEYETGAQPDEILYTQNQTTSPNLSPTRRIKFLYGQPGVTNPNTGFGPTIPVSVSGKIAVPASSTVTGRHCNASRCM
jgi:hypothetical protein